MAHLEYLVGYGLAGDFGRFRAAAQLELRRGQRVVVRSERGLEMGQVIRPAAERHARWLPNTSVGALLRLASPEDETQALAHSQRAADLLAHGTQLIEAEGYPVALLDAEILLEGTLAVVQHVRWGECDIRELVRPLSRRFDLILSLAELGAPPAHDDHGCGSCGSGEGCGSCGSGGGCGSCGSAPAQDAQAHFATLREQMERRMPLL